MPDIFISYARVNEPEARLVADALQALGHDVWRDDQLPAHRSYTDVIEEQLRAARAVLVLWSKDATQSQWVRAEANVAREAGRLIQLRLDDHPLPLPFNEIQCADCRGWKGHVADAAWQKVVNSINAVLGAPAQPVAAPTPATSAERLLAVLPFDNLSGDPDMGYFSDGISEEILHTVARTRGLRVIGKTSSFQFRGAEKSTRRIVSELGATHMLDGSVRRAGERVRVTAQLVDTRSQETLWSERYDRALTDIFALQDEIAAAIAGALEAQFTPGRAKGSIDPEAYDLYLKARAIYHQDATSADRARCVALLEQTVALAPDFAMAWGQLAVFRGLLLPKSSNRDDRQLRDLGRREADRALALDPDCGHAHVAKALLIPAFTGYAERIELIRSGYATAPQEGAIGHLYAGSLLAVGRNAEACRVFDEVAAREPGSPYAQCVRAFFHMAAGRVAQGMEIVRQAVVAFPESAYARFMLEKLERAQQMPFAESDAGVREAATKRLFDRIAAAAPVCHFVHAGNLARLGESDAAFTLLQDAIHEGRPLAIEPTPDGRGFSRTLASIGLFGPVVMGSLRADPRFADLCVRLGLYDYWRNSGHWPDCAADLPYDLAVACAAADRDSPPRYREAGT